MTQRDYGHADGWTYIYDAQNRLTTVKQGATTVAQYWYDGLNRQITRNLNGAITFHVWDGWNLIEERGTGNAIQNIYLYAGDQIIENVTTKRFYFQDSLGNTSHLSDEAGNLLERYTYSAFGMPSFYNAAGTLISASTKGTRHLFQGQLWTQQTGLNDYRNRVELPTMGVFLQPDPIGFRGDAANIYRFCGNNAVNRIDPLGLVNISATIWNRLAWFAGASILTWREDDLLKQGQAKFAEPTGNYKDKDVDNHTDENLSEPGLTRYTVSKMEEVDGILVIRPTLDWWVKPHLKHTDVVKRELEHVSRWLWWQSKGGKGWEAVRDFNSAPTGIKNLKTKVETARYLESRWQRQEIHRGGRHTLEKNPEKVMDAAEIERRIQNVGPDEFPHIRN